MTPKHTRYSRLKDIKVSKVGFHVKLVRKKTPKNTGIYWHIKWVGQHHPTYFFKQRQIPLFKYIDELISNQ